MEKHRVSNKENSDNVHENEKASMLENLLSYKSTISKEPCSELSEEISNFEVRDTDVWICTFPKSGSTWTHEMVWMIANNLDFEAAKVNLSFRVPYFEFSEMRDYRKRLGSRQDIKPPPCFMDSFECLRNLPDPRIIKSHLPYDLLPNQILNGTKNPKIIFVIRNPKEVCVSYYHHLELYTFDKLEFGEICESFLADRASYSSYRRNVMSYWKRRHQSNILALRFEDMKSDLKATIKQTANFLGKSLTEEEIYTLSIHLSFDNMKNNPATSQEVSIYWHLKFIDLDLDENGNDGASKFYRSGKVDTYKAVLSPQMIKRFDEYIGKYLSEVNNNW